MTLSLRPNPNDLLSGKLDSQLKAIINTAPPHSELTFWHENTTGNPLKYPRYVNNAHTAIKMQKYGKKLCHGTKVLFGVITVGPAIYQLHWMAPGLDWYGDDLYEFPKLRNPNGTFSKNKVVGRARYLHRRDLVVHPGLERLRVRCLVHGDAGQIHRAACHRRARPEPVPGVLQPHRCRGRAGHAARCSSSSPSAASSPVSRREPSSITYPDSGWSKSGIRASTARPEQPKPGVSGAQANQAGLAGGSQAGLIGAAGVSSRRRAPTARCRTWRTAG
jgi:hypothetical protein